MKFAEWTNLGSAASYLTGRIKALGTSESASVVQPLNERPVTRRRILIATDQGLADVTLDDEVDLKLDLVLRPWRDVRGVRVELNEVPNIERPSVRVTIEDPSFEMSNRLLLRDGLLQFGAACLKEISGR